MLFSHQEFEKPYDTIQYNIFMLETWQNSQLSLVHGTKTKILGNNKNKNN